MVHCAIDMKEIHYQYPDGHIALDKINFQVGLHERAVILGANGAGKSTLLSIMCGIIQADQGSIKILDKELTSKNVHELRPLIGLVFQEPDNQLFMPTLWEDVAFGPLNMGLSEDEVHARVNEALQVVGLTDLQEKPPHHLSVGEKKRAAIATVLSMRPKILVFDEPTAHMDPRSREEFVKFLSKLHSEGDLTIITATHDVNIVPYLAERAYVLSEGKFIGAGSISDIFSNISILDQANLEPPILVQLFQETRMYVKKMDGKPLPLTLSEATSFFQKNYTLQRKISS
ncbi:MAG: energy-coupling factor ABC transporter ATP-binding protein [Candidatus Thorarchaeota archaeon]